MDEKLKKFVMDNLGFIAVAFISVVYILSSVLQAGTTGKSIGNIIFDGAMTFILGMSFNILLGLQGMIRGDNDPRVKETSRLHAEAVERIAEHIDRLAPWCEERNAENLKAGRTRILAKGGMKYEDCFDEDDSPKPFEWNKTRLSDKYLRREELRRYKAYREAVELEPTPLSVSALTGESEGQKQDDRYSLGGRTKLEYEKQTTRTDAVSKVMVALVFGYFGFELVTDFSYALLIWNALQVGVCLVMGVIKMMQSFNFVVDEHRGRTVNKINYLQMFESYIKKKEEGE